MVLVEFDDFSFKYLGADSLALRKVDLTIEKGEYVVITGPSGCGKTTLCRAINGLVPQFHRGYIAGHVYIDGIDTIITMASINGYKYDTLAEVNTAIQQVNTLNNFVPIQGNVTQTLVSALQKSYQGSEFYVLESNAITSVLGTPEEVLID